MKRRGGRMLFWAAVLGLMLSPTARACPNCKEAVSAQAEDVANMAQGYSWSIMLMLSMPATLLGTGALLVRHAVKSGRMPEL